MSRNLEEKLFEVIPLTATLPIEVSDEEVHNRTSARHQHEDSDIRRLTHFLDKEVPAKTYRLVFNRQDESVSFEPQSAEAQEVAPTKGKLALDERIAEAIEASQRILALEDNWDEEGSIGYKKSTWDRATAFIRDTAISYWRVIGSWAVPPRILPGPEGSIDIHWKTANRELLINIPSDEKVPAGYYGSGGPQDTVKGKLDTSSQNLWVLTWLLR